MINLRFHIVSLAAVLIALAVGVVAGTSVLDQQVVRNLEAQQRTLSTLRAQTQAENALLRQELDLWERYGRSIEVAEITGRLSGRTIVLVTKADVPGDLTAAVEDLVLDAGARLAGRLAFTPKWKLEDDTARAQLALALGQPDTTELERLTTDAATRIAARLRTAADPSSDADLLSQMQRAGFVTTHDLATGPFPAAGAMMLFLSPGTTESLPPDRTFMLPLLKGLAGGPHAVVAEPLDAAESVADRVRGDGDLRAAVATVDHVDTIPGRISLVEALRGLAQGLDAMHFGVGRRTSGVAPSPSPAP